MVNNNDSFLLPSHKVKRQGHVGYLTRDIEYIDPESGIKVHLNKGREIMVLEFTLAPAFDKTKEQVIGEILVAECYVPNSPVGPSASPVVIYADAVMFKEISSNSETYHDISAVEFLQRATTDESKRKIFLPSELK